MKKSKRVTVGYIVIVIVDECSSWPCVLKEEPNAPGPILEACWYEGKNCTQKIALFSTRSEARKVIERTRRFSDLWYPDETMSDWKDMRIIGVESLVAP